AVVGPGVRGEPEPAADGGAVADGGEEERAVVDPLARRAVVRAADLDVRLRPEPERSEHGGEVAGTAAEPLEPRRLRRRERVEPDPDGVDEGGLVEEVVGGLAPADDPGVDGHDPGAEERADGLGGLFRDAEEAGEVVAGAERDHAEDGLTLGGEEAGGDLLQRAVAAGGDDGVEARGGVAGEHGGVVGPPGGEDLERRAGGFELGDEVGAGAAGAAVAGGGVQDDGERAGRHRRIGRRRQATAALAYEAARAVVPLASPLRARSAGPPSPSSSCASSAARHGPEPPPRRRTTSAAGSRSRRRRNACSRSRRT